MSIWIPLSESESTNNSAFKPNHTIFDLQELRQIIPIKEHGGLMPRHIGFRKRFLYAKTTLPDLDNGNSNSSDGS